MSGEGSYPYSTDALARLHDEDRWHTIEPVLCRVADLIPTQSSVTIARLQDLLVGGQPETGDPYPHVVAHSGCLFVHDGHHRWAIALVRGYAVMRCRVVDEHGATIHHTLGVS